MNFLFDGESSGLSTNGVCDTCRGAVRKPPAREAEARGEAGVRAETVRLPRKTAAQRFSQQSGRCTAPVPADRARRCAGPSCGPVPQTHSGPNPSQTAPQTTYLLVSRIEIGLERRAVEPSGQWTLSCCTPILPPLTAHMRGRTHLGPRSVAVGRMARANRLCAVLAQNSSSGYQHSDPRTPALYAPTGQCRVSLRRADRRVRARP
jgi:hypothetical protein